MTTRARRFTPRGAALIAAGLLVSGGSPLAAQERLVAWHEIERAVHSNGPAVVRAPTAALLLSGLVGGNLPLAALATVEPSVGPTSPLTVQIEVDPRPLTVDDSRRVVVLDIFAYALDAAGRIAASVSHRLSLDLGARRSRLERGGIQLLTTLLLPPGEYRLRALVRDQSLGAFGVTELAITVPSSRTSSTTGWPLERRDEWVVALPARGGPFATRPLRVDRADYLPAALPVWPPESASLAILSTPAGTDPPTFSARLESADGTATAALEAAPIRRANPVGDRDNYIVELRIPDLPYGRYELITELQSGGELRQPVFVWRHPEGRVAAWKDLPTGDELIVTDLVRPEDHASDERASQTAVDLTALATGYKATLGALAIGDATGAAAALRALEASADRADYDTLRWLEKTEWSAASRLASRSPEQFLSLFLLHVAQIEHYRAHQRSRLGELSVRIAGKIGREIRQRANDPLSVETAALSTALLGETLRQSGRMDGSQTLFRQALALDPTVKIALFGLAIAEEKTGHYAEAVTTLSRLTQVDPEDFEARLRLAVNLKRVGQPEDAADLLRSLEGTAAPDWIHLVAVQESARIAVAAGEEKAALEQMRAAARRWPGDQTVAVYLSFLLDRRGRPGQARQPIERLAASAPSGRPSARHRYTLAPPAELEELRTLLAERASVPATTNEASAGRADGHLP